MAKCFWCDGTGKFKQPRDNEMFDKIFDSYDSAGIFNMGECREKALKETGYDLVQCKHCNGTGIEKD